MRLHRALLPPLLMSLAVAALGLPGFSQPALAAGRPASAGALTIFRVDVSRYPSVGFVVTVPDASGTLPSDDFAVMTGSRHVRPEVRRLSPDDVELILAPDAGLPSAALRAEQAAATGFLTGLPAGERTAAVDPAVPEVLPKGLSGDPAPAVATVATLASGTRSSATARLETALSTFTAGSRVRRAIVLAVSADQSLRRSLAARVRAQLAASGTSLYVLDAAPGGAPGYDALAAGSGGFAARIRVPGDWTAAFALVTASLGEQYYLRFTDARPLPGLVRVSVRTRAGELHGVADLPVRNPIAPPPLPFRPAHAMPVPLTLEDTPFVLLAALLIIIGVSYGLAMLLASRWDPPRLTQRRQLRGARRRALPRAERQPIPDDSGDLFFVFVMPCLNEEKVILNSLRRLLSIPGGNFVVLVVDDGSDDGTADVVSGAVGDRVWLLRRRPPEARQGKGEALNAAVRYLTGGGHLDGRDANRVIVVVVDADGRLDPETIEQVTPYFADPATGAVQIGVRINNRGQSRLARMQDMEFVIYTEVFQRGRRHLGSVGLGGNGQFMRLSAMLSLGPAPWTRSLTDDLDLGVRMIAAGWRNEYCADVAVHQQGVVELRRLIRQRSRWFQGHLQTWKLIPLVLRKAPRRARADLLYHLSSPAMLLIASLMSASFLLSVVNAVLVAAQGRDPLGWWVASTYALTFGPALAFSSVYWSREHRNGFGVLRTVMFAHLFVCYGMMWYASGWWAVGRTLRGRTGWAKTDRVAESPPAASTPAVPAAVRHRRGAKRRRVAVLAAAVAGICAVGAVAAAHAGHLGDGSADWLPVFTGYGTTSVAGSGASLVVTLDPARATAPDVSHAALVVSARSYPNFVATMRVRTVKQLRRGAAGQPEPWDVGWVVWHYTSARRFYALTLEPAGWELSKQDPAYRGGERFLASGLAPRFPAGSPYTVGIVQVGDQITVSADGQVLARFTDTRDPYLSGAVGFYSEDARAVFDRIRINQLPAPPALKRLGPRVNPTRERQFLSQERQGSMGHSQESTREKRKIMVVYGTRPEAIKVAPLIRALEESEFFTPQAAVTAQHRSMLDQVNEVFGIKPDFDLDIHSPGQTLAEITTRVLTGVHELLVEQRPDAVVVQGDTTTVFAAALAAFYEKIPVAHLEAGLRTGDPRSPYPEEINRQLATRLAALHLAPTATSKANLLAENVDPATVVVTGNTVIDALLWTVGQNPGYREPAYGDPVLDRLDCTDAPVLLVTAHRRESWGAPLRAIGRALARIAGEHDGLRIVFPIHRNPVVRDAILPAVQGLPNVIVTEPLPYAGFARLMNRSTVILTDSGGVQEEGPSLGKPVLVMRDTTERPEAVSAGTVRLVGADEDRIVAAVGLLLTDLAAYAAMASAVNPYGDGRAAERSVAALAHHFRLGPPAEEFHSGPARGKGSTRLCSISEKTDSGWRLSPSRP